MSGKEEKKEKTERELAEEELERRKEQFIREKVKKKRVPFKVLAERFVTFHLKAVLFGVIASLILVFFEPLLSRYLPTVEDVFPILKEKERVTLSRGDSENTSSETGESTEQETAELTPDELKARIDAAVEEALANYRMSDQNAMELQLAITERINAVNRSVVQVQSSGVTRAAAQERKSVAGLLWYATEDNYYILSDYAELKGSTELQISLSNGQSIKGVLLGSDGVTGIAVASCRREEAEEAGITVENIATVGSSYGVNVGSMVLCVGSPEGPVFSATSGMITYVSPSNMDVDTELGYLFTNIPITGTGTGFLFSVDGKLVGIITSATRVMSEGGDSAAIAISDLKAILETLARGERLSYLGIEGVNITPALAEERKMPVGVYVSNALIGSPAYNSGIVNGDIITMAGEEKITDMRSLQAALSYEHPGEFLEVTVSRLSRGGYVEQKFTVILGTR